MNMSNISNINPIGDQSHLLNSQEHDYRQMSGASNKYLENREQRYQTASFSNNNAGPRKQLLTITIEIGNGQNENILIREGDSPRDIAHEFAKKHGISG